MLDHPALSDSPSLKYVRSVSPIEKSGMGTMNSRVAGNAYDDMQVGSWS